LKSGRVAALLNPMESKTKQQKLENDDLDSYDYDLIVVGGGSGGLACSKVFSKQNNNSTLNSFF
jgi:ribulose 1,5-bisphosphate synthetase/thiazole synthase